MTKKNTPIESKKLITSVLAVEDNSVIINVDGWRMRVYFDMQPKELKEVQSNKDNFRGRNIEVEYTGDLEDVFNLTLLPLRSFS